MKKILGLSVIAGVGLGLSLGFEHSFLLAAIEGAAYLGALALLTGRTPKKDWEY